jgi:glycosyltransferase involved in cell wall biosynthesis
VPIIQLQHIRRDLSLGADTAGFKELYKAIRAVRPDILHLNSSKAGGLGALAARLLGVPTIIFTVHGWPFEEKRSAAWRLLAFLGSWATAFLAHRVIVISEYDLKIAKKIGFKNTAELIHNGIDFAMAFGPADMVRQSFPSGVTITGTIGELTRNKNQISLIEQAKNEPSLYVALVGEGEDRLYLTSKIAEYGLEERVKIMGFHYASEVLRGFDVFAFPSLKEGLPYVLLEAKAAGLPIVANRVGGVPDVLDAPDMSDFTLARMLQKTTALYR